MEAREAWRERERVGVRRKRKRERALERERKRGRERGLEWEKETRKRKRFSICNSPPNCHRAEAGYTSARIQEPPPGLPLGCRGPRICAILCCFPVGALGDWK